MGVVVVGVFVGTMVGVAVGVVVGAVVVAPAEMHPLYAPCDLLLV